MTIYFVCPEEEVTSGASFVTILDWDSSKHLVQVITCLLIFHSVMFYLVLLLYFFTLNAFVKNMHFLKTRHSFI